MSALETLQRRKRQLVTGINVLVAAKLTVAAQELEGVLLDIDSQILGITFKEMHGEVG